MPCDHDCKCEPIEEDYCQEQFEEFSEETPDVYSQKQIIGLSIDSNNSRFGVPGQVNFRITNVALALTNEQQCKHIISVSYGEFNEKYVIARLLPGVVESLSIDILIPASLVEQQISLSVEGGDCGAVDVVGILEYVKNEPTHEQQNEIVNDFMESSSESEQPVIKTLQQQRDEMLKEKLQKAAEKEIQKAKEMKNQIPEFRNFKQLQMRDDITGRGKECKVGNKVMMKYELRLTNEKGKVLDSTKGNQKFKFTVGRGEVIKGWDLGIPGMKEGGKRTIIVPPHLGYGGQQTGPIPANSILYFSVELVQVI
ncbi:Peptidylprolyl isomerase [Spironucleus salmonicida]|uniref:peptidylprolyl isomerase n=1 Tax=Spironucleus salmonicida TaxID=348837 RepID=V6LLK0_9EUKA|nr:Peptidylprolyl isomerase [Spironucleus salmonicida]|eukprot:EST45550.1 FKBP-type peptidyl-prolyl cis-trans isomerase [Spironucleus salmonicida]